MRSLNQIQAEGKCTRKESNYHCNNDSCNIVNDQLFQRDVGYIDPATGLADDYYVAEIID